MVSAVEFGLFIALPDTCEGLLHTDNMPDGEYVCDDMVSLKTFTNGMEYRVGDPIRVKVINANVNSGKIDFKLLTRTKICYIRKWRPAPSFFAIL